MTTSMPNCNVAQQYPAYDFNPSYNAVQLNLKNPTLNAPAAPMQPPVPMTGQNNWIA